MLNRLLIVLSLSAVPAAGAAQQAPPGLPAPVRETGVTLTVAGYLLPSTSGRLAVPLPLLEQLAGENALLAVDTAPVGGASSCRCDSGSRTWARSSGGTRTSGQYGF